MSRKPKILLDLPFPVDRLQVSSFFTSRPYPVIHIDALDVSGDLTRLNVPPSTVEGVDIGASVLSLELRELLVGYQYEEALDASASVISIDLSKDLIVSYNGGAEALDTDASVLSIELEVGAGFVQTIMAPEGMDISATVLSLELI